MKIILHDEETPIPATEFSVSMTRQELQDQLDSTCRLVARLSDAVDKLRNENLGLKEIIKLRESQVIELQKLNLTSKNG